MFICNCRPNVKTNRKKNNIFKPLKLRQNKSRNTLLNHVGKHLKLIENERGGIKYRENPIFNRIQFNLTYETGVNHLRGPVFVRAEGGEGGQSIMEQRFDLSCRLVKRQKIASELIAREGFVIFFLGFV